MICHLLVGGKGWKGLETLVTKSDKDSKMNDFSMVLFLNGTLIRRNQTQTQTHETNASRKTVR